MIALRHGLWIMLLILNAACSDSKPPPISPLHSDSIILSFGDSLTYGTGAATTQSYPAELSRLLDGVRVINAGVPGELSAQGRARLPELLEQHQPQLVILCHGGNDLLRRQDRNALQDNLRAMLQAIKQQGADAILIGVPQPSLTISVPDFYTAIADEFNIPYLGEILPDVLGDENLKSDPIHPNAAGYRQVGFQAVADVIRQAQ
ncbi:MAG: arylesterase [Gammaproteobacteria bacterium]